jgi:hypothetical protein
MALHAVLGFVVERKSLLGNGLQTVPERMDLVFPCAVHRGSNKAPFQNLK